MQCCASGRRNFVRNHLDIFKCAAHQAAPLDFLYQTRTLQRSNIHHSYLRRNEVRRDRTDQRRSLQESRRDRPEDEQQTYSYVVNDIPFDGEIDQRPSKSSEARAAIRRDTTMSKTERDAFAKLFNSLTKERLKHRTGDKDERTLESSQHRLEDDFEELEQSADDYTFLDRMVDEIEQAENPNISKYPAGLRDMAAKAQIQLARSRAQQTKRSQEELADPQFVAERRELKRIERAMYDARSDIELWKILETEVFPDMRRIQLDSEQVPERDHHEEHHQEHDQEIADDISPAITLTSDSSTSPATGAISDVPKFNFTIRAYPALILLAMRLACRRTTYTPLALSLLGQIKSIGFSAYVLAASTSLYNELLLYHWRVFYDPGRMLGLLKEMQSSGLPMDNKTLAILHEATLYRYRALKGELGNAARDVEQLAGRSTDANEIAKWKKRVQKQLEEQALETAKRAELERKVRAEGGFADDDQGIDAPFRRGRAQAVGSL